MIGDYRVVGELEEGGVNLFWRGLRVFLSSLWLICSFECGVWQQFGFQFWLGCVGFIEVVLFIFFVFMWLGGFYFFLFELVDVDFQGVQGGFGFGVVYGDGLLGVVVVWFVV